MLNICVYDTVRSTNLVSRKFIESGSLNYSFAIFSHKQTAGYGKQGKTWDSLAGNCHLSSVFNISQYCDISYLYNNIGILSLLSSLAVLKEIEKLCVCSFPMEFQLFLKWPNDVLLNGSKIAGILIELCFGLAGELYIIIGIGVNIMISPKILDYPTTSLFTETKIKVNPLTFAENLVFSLEQLMFSFKQDKDYILKNWIKYAYRLNEVIKIKKGHNLVDGIFKGISDKGDLLLEQDKRIFNIVAGEFIN